MKKVKESMKAKGKSDEEVTAFEKGASGYAKKIVANFKDYDFYVGESMDPDGMVVLMNFREDGVTPFVTIWKDALSEVRSQLYFPTGEHMADWHFRRKFNALCWQRGMKVPPEKCGMNVYLKHGRWQQQLEQASGLNSTMSDHVSHVKIGIMT